MIEVRQLTKRYRSTRAVDGLTFEVKPGYVAGFLGPNGAGKSTTMRAILGLDRPTSGEALVDGRRYADIRRPMHHVGALLDAGAVHGGRSAYDHLRVLARSNGIKDRRVVATLEQVGLASAAEQRVGSLSLGMKQRLGVAAALLGDPGVLLFDEPVNGLDPEGIRWIRHLMRGLAREGRTVLVSSHLMSEMALTADRVIVIGRGKLILEASMRDLEERFKKDVLVRSPVQDALAAVLHAAGATARPEDSALLVQGLDAPGIADLAARHHIPIHELTPRSASLEDVYLELTDDSLEYRTTDSRPDSRRPNTRPASDPAASDPAASDPAGSRPADSRLADSRPADSRPADPRPADPRPTESRPAECRTADSRRADSRAADPRPAESRRADPRPAESRRAESRPAESRPADSRPADARPADSSPADSSPAEFRSANSRASEANR